ncbi:bifunctional 4-hydroxy-2-oxoglutarate aldolase/2-dehydro-3-deoxy-phosphogluconate aldolase [Sphingomonas segetis]|jgi:2-dehydro-3-deoxyphosphogluconate aldolase/(4S)-4-hydroxy-2-oxoglutarate aldolase|uniref:bifunctional 4-hydroxy-2-oxoglutarate aldolase/2-dehydro-3-deoxy-phosphogluconate aldolase n=1 Tax=Sphingomonas segetis TaxID=1104779 RepID=UPI0012D3552B|nr:bifunctional 4-hydroxy-2-oxoglutarate aldolase/2-dehydro-3-deoxy-phosphogluconate aldolase [Sphingomonas segetis]
MTMDDIMRAAPVIPVLVLEGDEDWAKLAETFVGAGLTVLEVTLRTPGALDAIRQMSKVPGAIVGAGTIVNERQLGEAVDAGARFIVSPGLTEPLARAVTRSGVAYLPGVATAGDIMRGLDLGLDRFKFFPAEASGGIAALRSLSGPFGGIRFCPTGGIRPDNAADWLALDSVLCVGGTWLYRRGDSMDAVAERARTAAALRN